MKSRNITEAKSKALFSTVLILGGNSQVKISASEIIDFTQPLVFFFISPTSYPWLFEIIN
jgi:hypothetical protein